MRMIPIFLGLVVAALAATAGALVAALGIPDPGAIGRAEAVQRHQLTGLVAAVLLLTAQCALFVYFLGTGKAIKTAVEARGLDPDLARRTRKLKGKTFPFATFAALAVVVGSVMAGSSSPEAHATAMYVALGMTALAVPFEIRSLAENSRLMDRTADAVESAESAMAARGASLDDPDAAPPAFLLGRGLLVVALSVWLVFAYRAVVMRAQPDPWPWYVAVSAVAVALGLPLLVAGRRRPGAAPHA